MQYITADDKTRLEDELSQRIDMRKTLSDRIGKARELGDLKENGEYHAAREDQGLNEAKIRELEAKLATAVVADTETLPDGMVFIGATVKLREVDSGDEEVFHLVGEATGKLDSEYIEVTSTSPMGVALMKATVGEVVRVDLPRGEKHFEIVEIL